MRNLFYFFAATLLTLGMVSCERHDDDRELFMKGIDYSYYYEQED